MFGLIKHWRYSFNMRLFVNEALEQDPMIKKDIIAEVMSVALLAAKSSPEWKKPFYDIKTQSFIFLVTGIEGMIQLATRKDSLESKVYVSQLKRLMGDVVFLANTHDIFRVHPGIAETAREQYYKLTI